MQTVTNTHDIPLALAVWALYNDYDYVNEENYISVTGLMKPIRHILLPSRIPDQKKKQNDVEDFIASAIGRSLHDSIEKVWKIGYKRSLQLLGYPDSVIERVKINPTEEELEPNTIPVYLEQRTIREFMGYKIGGKYDMVAEGIVHDNKSTTAYTWLYGGKDNDYKMQGSLYRWLNPKIIVEDFIRINFIFTDWQKAQALANPNYPQKRLGVKEIPLMSLKETEEWIAHKLNQIKKFQDAPESQIPECTKEELWMTDPTYKYYSDPTKIAGKSTKNFDNLHDANKFAAEKGKGVVITIPGTAKRCEYCDAFEGCSQKDRYL